MSDLLRADLSARTLPDPDHLATVHRRARVAQGMLIAYGLTLLGSVVFYALRPYATTNTPAIVDVVVFLLTATAFASWQVAAYRLVPVFSGTAADRTPGAAAWGYLIPIANLWIPYQVMREIDDASDPDAVDPGLVERRAGPPLRTWWALWISMGVSSRIYERIPVPAPGQDALAYEIAGLVLVVGWFALIAAALVVIQRVNERQQETARLIAEAQG